MKKLAMILSLACIASADPMPGMPLNEASTTLLKSARIETGKSWDISFNVAFNEYYVAEEGLVLAEQFSTTAIPTMPVVAFDYDYHPGFQLGFTLNTPYDKWAIAGEYLYVRATNQVSATAAEDSSIFSNLTFANDLFNNFLSELSANWSLGVDLADLYLTRPFYAGKNWTVAPLLGLRTGWVREYLHALCVASPLTTAVFNANSWSIGPRAGFQSNWLLGKGFSFFGNLAASLLYTQYSKLTGKNSAPGSDLGTIHDNHSSSLSPNLDTGLGVRWGSYFSGQDYYFDLSAAYNFYVFFAQRQISMLSAMAGSFSSGSPGKLYFHGLSIATSFCF